MTEHRQGKGRALEQEFRSNPQRLVFEPDERDGLRTATGILIAVLVGCALWLVICLVRIIATT